VRSQQAGDRLDDVRIYRRRDGGLGMFRGDDGGWLLVVEGRGGEFARGDDGRVGGLCRLHHQVSVTRKGGWMTTLTTRFPGDWRDCFVAGFIV
jgi:hypothetical protein